MRRAISFLVAAALLSGGLYLLYFLVFHSDRISKLAFVGAGMVAFVGGAWLIGDFVLPALRGKDKS